MNETIWATLAVLALLAVLATFIVVVVIGLRIAERVLPVRVAGGFPRTRAPDMQAVDGGRDVD
jgi:hypothetical protein